VKNKKSANEEDEDPIVAGMKVFEIQGLQKIFSTSFIVRVRGNTEIATIFIQHPD